ncbi:helix-turn-helix transcriptional regulator [Microbacterium sp. SD291]|uniref:helix-turn-helix domain-containing protein n=1 Tax=Microbacterium sp. SD291 TaxID=2782007 RepID=UPI001A96E56F|nr:helix-turn-helix transcriptional regulator [Microbacterium sp. SD291]MBO0979590.1 helix-turn-helix transcriptional regulator [Microbacterium sp. SD291]
MNDVGCAPHIAARLFAELGGDQVTIRDVALRLDPAQRQGLRPLPSPLPMVASIEVRYDSMDLPPRDLDLLVAAAVRLDDDLAPLLAFDGRSAEEIATSAAGRHLRVRAGRVRLRDPLLLVWIRASTPPSAEASVHERLSAVFDAREDRVSADWHRARASLQAEPATAPELTRIARELSEAGHQDRALLLAAEAAAHAEGRDLDEARLVAGATSIAAGYATEAAAWLGSLFSDGAERYRLQGLGALIVAQAHLHGAVPDVEPGSLRPSTDDREDWYGWARAAALGAVLCAERGDRRRMRSWLDALREGCARVGAEQDLRDPVVSLAWLIAGEGEAGDAAGSGPLTGGLLQALRSAMTGDIDGGLRVLAVSESGIGTEVDPFVAGFEHSPIVKAYRAVVEALLLVWRGDLGVARDNLLRASCELPVALPFAGLGVILARRLDLAVLGRLGPFALSLTGALPAALRIDRFVDRGIRSYLAGSFEEASSYLRLWSDRGAPQASLSVPGLEEMALGPDGVPSSGRRIEPPDAALAHHLMTRIATTPDSRWRADGPNIVDAARSLFSPFARARVETMLGIRAVIREDHAAGRSHLRTARGLFEVAGAAAWAHAVDERLARVDPVTGSAQAIADPLSACRSMWEAMLTARELEVAMLVVGGATNRDIGEALSVSVRTVEVHLGRVFVKLEVRTRLELTVLAHRTGQYA